MKASSSIRSRLSIVFAVVALILIVILSIVIGMRSIKQVQNEIGNSLGEVVFLMGDKLDHYMWARYGETHILSELYDVRQPDDLERVETLFNQLKKTFPSFAWIGFTDKDGTVIASTDGILEGVNISERPVYSEALNGTFIGDVHEAVLLAELLPNPKGEAMKFVDISTPVYDLDGHFIGVLATHLSWEWIKEIEESISEPLQNRNNVEFLIVSKKNNVVILGPKEMIGHSLHIESIELARTNKQGWTLETWPDGKQYLTGFVLADGYKEYPGLDWTILARKPVEVAYAPTKDLLGFILAVGLILVALFATAGWFVADRIARPLKEITRVADRLSEGADTEIPRYKGIVEIESLSDSLRKMVENLTRMEKAMVNMEDEAYHDHLTGLPNRKAFNLYIEKSTQTYDTLTVLYLDLDGFKAVNDTLGHDAGDKLLIDVANRLKQNIRGNELVARIGGDEFVIVLPSLIDPLQNGKAIGERIISMINEPYYISGETVTIGCSVGGAVWHHQMDNIDEVIRLADKALYEIKRSGKNQVYLYESTPGIG